MLANIYCATLTYTTAEDMAPIEFKDFNAECDVLTIREPVRLRGVS